MNGEWQGLRFNEATGEQEPFTLSIKQTWTKIRFEFTQEGYRCVSYATAIQTRYPLGTRVSVAIQIFRVSKQQLRKKLNLSDDELQGRYYTNPQVCSHSLLTCTKRNKNESPHS